MKTLILILSLIISVQGFSQSQSDLTKTSMQSLQKADKDLNAIYQKLLTNYKSDAPFIKNLKAAQKLWIQFRDAEMKMKYPDRGPGYYGSSLPMCKADYQAALTRDRINTLQQWIDGVEEGDVCAGSIRMKK
jgi:uncharacterized protein YecT (DUF1311 family)